MLIKKPQKSRTNWQYIYYVLAAFDVLAVSFGLYLNHNLVHIYDTSVQNHSAWTGRMNAILDLSSLAAEVNAPGNNVFVTHNTSYELQNLLKAKAKFTTSYNEIRSEIDINVTEPVRAELLKTLDTAYTTMAQMVSETENIFDSLDNNDKETAGNFMAIMDGSFYQLNKSFSSLTKRITRLQSDYFAAERIHVNDLKLWETVIASMIFVMVVMITIYGHFLAKKIKRQEMEKQAAINSLYEYEQRQDAILETAADAIITISNTGIVESFNDTASRIFGYAPTEVIGKNVSMLMPDEDSGHHDNYLRNYSGKRISNIIGADRELIARRKNGELFPIELAVSEVELSDRKIFTGIIRDISERKKLQKIKSEFISTVSHELRTPLTVIHGALKLIDGCGDSLAEKERHNILSNALRNSERLTHLIDDLLDLQKLDSTGMTFEHSPVSVTQLLSEAIQQNQLYADKHQVDFSFNPTKQDVVVMADKFRLLQVLANLMSNAAKFSPQHSTISLFFDANENEVTISVQDAGPGISEEFRDRLFERFFQIDSSDSRTKGGTGLGLNISKVIIEKHGGTINFKSTLGKGTRFYFTLPLPDPSNQPS